jgi:Tfp pilus assembly protein PilF
VLALFLLEKLGAVRREDIEPKVRAGVDRALCLNERASTSLLCLAKQEYRYDWQWEKAEQHFRQAIEADPQDADVFNEFSILLSALRRFEESLNCVRRACVLEPLSPAARLQAGHASYANGQWDAAVVHYQRLLRYTPGHVFARWGLADAFTRSGQPSDAITSPAGRSVTGRGRSESLVADLAVTNQGDCRRSQQRSTRGAGRAANE